MFNPHTSPVSPLPQEVAEADGVCDGERVVQLRDRIWAELRACRVWVEICSKNEDSGSYEAEGLCGEWAGL